MGSRLRSISLDLPVSPRERRDLCRGHKLKNMIGICLHYLTLCRGGFQLYTLLLYLFCIQDSIRCIHCFIESNSNHFRRQCKYLLWVNIQDNSLCISYWNNLYRHQVLLYKYHLPPYTIYMSIIGRLVLPNPKSCSQDLLVPLYFFLKSHIFNQSNHTHDSIQYSFLFNYWNFCNHRKRGYINFPH